MQRKIVGEPISGYPGLHMVERALGPRAMLVGRRLRVLDIAVWVHHGGESEEEVAVCHGLDPEVVATAMRYYRDHKDLVESWIREEQEYFDRAEAEWRRRYGHTLT